MIDLLEILNKTESVVTKETIEMIMCKNELISLRLEQVEKNRRRVTQRDYKLRKKRKDRNKEDDNNNAYSIADEDLCEGSLDTDMDEVIEVIESQDRKMEQLRANVEKLSKASRECEQKHEKLHKKIAARKKFVCSMQDLFRRLLC